MYLNKAAKKALAAMIGEMADLATCKDIDAGVMLAEQMASQCGIKAEDIPGLSELRKL